MVNELNGKNGLRQERLKQEWEAETDEEKRPGPEEQREKNEGEGKTQSHWLVRVPVGGHHQ